MRKYPKTRGFRNNNPLYIPHGTCKWNAMDRKKQLDKEYVTFNTLAEGYRAGWKLMESFYFRFMGKMNYDLYHIIHAWITPQNGKHPDEYIRQLLLFLLTDLSEPTEMSGGRSMGGIEQLFQPSSPKGAASMARILAAMTCVENDIPYKEVPREAILNGFKLAFPGAVVPHVKW